MKEALTFDDVSIIPKYSEIESRSDCNTRTQITTNHWLDIPIIATPMDSVCESRMAALMYDWGGIGFIHRFMSIKDQVKEIEKTIQLIEKQTKEKLVTHKYPIGAAIGIKDVDKARSSALIEAGVDILMIDVAHAHHIGVKRTIEWLKYNYPNTDLFVGTVATAEAVRDLLEWGADGIHVGIGGGCFTPEMEVMTSKGSIPIINVNIGDMVYSHDGTLQKVINKFEFDRNEEIMIIDGIECTKNHEFYVVHEKYADVVTDTNIHQYAEWIAAENLTKNYFKIEGERILIEMDGDY